MIYEHDSGIVNVDLGSNVKIIKPVNLYSCVLSDDVFIGPFVEIQKNLSCYYLFLIDLFLFY